MIKFSLRRAFGGGAIVARHGIYIVRGAGEASKKVAFTLAEVLITLGIIGVVSALTLPVLISHYKVKQLEIGFKVADSIIQQAVRSSLNELGYEQISDIDVSSMALIQQNMDKLNEAWNKQFVKGDRDTTGLKYYHQKIYMYGILGDNKQSYFAYKNTNILPNGVLVSDFSYIWEGGKARYGFWFDTNGPYKGPNRLGHDIFVYYDKDYGDRTSLCNPTIGHSEKEKGCYQWARRNVSPIDKSKSYWDILFKPKSYWKK